MDLELTDEQELLRETTARFIESECPLTQVRELIEDPVGSTEVTCASPPRSAGSGPYPRGIWRGSVSGAGLLDAAVIAEERGGMVNQDRFCP